MLWSLADHLFTLILSWNANPDVNNSTIFVVHNAASVTSFNTKLLILLVYILNKLYFAAGRFVTHLIGIAKYEHWNE